MPKLKLVHAWSRFLDLDLDNNCQTQTDIAARGLVDREPGIDPVTHMGGGKADSVRWIAWRTTYKNPLVCLRFCGTPAYGGHFEKWPLSASASNYML